jgi:hypothetical protein
MAFSFGAPAGESDRREREISLPSGRNNEATWQFTVVNNEMRFFARPSRRAASTVPKKAGGRP